ncbi:hypothetical protein MTR67_035591 [Solanum verrucosum]|uniref:Uncharacterized protein n=1 Tax=Solanum verrucosum TaxID=315347 RepID=A0AAF0UAW1_SOLVR|nr:hypothetical protein MTR67_035591 [Solanum verrucosum]
MFAVSGNIRKIMLPTCNKMLMISSFKCWIGSMTKRGKQVWKSKVYFDENGSYTSCLYVGHGLGAFYGLLRFDVTSASCGFTSTTHDPCMDISLDLSACNSSQKDFASKSSKPNESLVGCLDLFIRPEKLGSDQKLYCENYQE